MLIFNKNNPNSKLFLYHKNTLLNELKFIKLNDIL